MENTSAVSDSSNTTSELEMNFSLGIPDFLKRCAERWPGIRVDELTFRSEKKKRPCEDRRCGFLHEDVHPTLFVNASDAYRKRIAEQYLQL